MGNEQTKIKVSKRRLKDDNAVRKQVKIAKAHGLTNKDKIFSLEESFFNKKIFFIVKNLNHILGDCRLSFDWCSSAQMRVSLDEYNPEAILDGLLNDHRLPFKRKDRFYMFPIIQIKRDT